MTETTATQKGQKPPIKAAETTKTMETNDTKNKHNTTMEKHVKDANV